MSNVRKFFSVCSIILAVTCGPSQNNAKLPQGNFKIVAMEYGDPSIYENYKKSQALFMQSTLKIDGHKIVVLGPYWHATLKYSLDSDEKFGSISLFDLEQNEERYTSGIFRFENGLITVCSNDDLKEGAPTCFTPRPGSSDLLLSVERISE